MSALTLISAKKFSMNIVGFMLLIRCASSKLDVCWVFVWPVMKGRFFDSCWFGVLYFEYKNNLTSCSGD